MGLCRVIHYNHHNVCYIHYHNWNGADIKRRLYRNWKIQNRNPFSKVDSECSCEDKSIFKDYDNHVDKPKACAISSQKIDVELFRISSSSILIKIHISELELGRYFQSSRKDKYFLGPPQSLKS